MTSAMKEIQMAVLDLITATVQVRKVNGLLIIVYFCNYAHSHRKMVVSYFHTHILHHMVIGFLYIGLWGPQFCSSSHIFIAVFPSLVAMYFLKVEYSQRLIE